MRCWIRHMFTPPWAVCRTFPKLALQAIEAAIRASETSHDGEICFAVEAHLTPRDLWRGLSPRQRAIEVFSNLRVWDTEHNSGVLIYLLLADRDVEIVADRGIGARVPPTTWQAICRRMEHAFREGRFEEGVLCGIQEIGTLLAAHFPASQENPDELPNPPVIL